VITDLVEIVWLAGILPTAFFWIFLQGYVNKRFLQKKSDVKPPVIFGALLSFVWPLELLFSLLYFGGKAFYSLGEGRGMHVNSQYDEVKGLIRARDEQLGQLTALALKGDLDGLRALVNPDDALRAIARHEESVSKPDTVLNKDGEEISIPSMGKPNPLFISDDDQYWRDTV
jgi:hypothetical protein